MNPQTKQRSMNLTGDHFLHFAPLVSRSFKTTGALERNFRFPHIV